MGAEKKQHRLHRPEHLSQDKPRKDDLPQPGPAPRPAQGPTKGPAQRPARGPAKKPGAKPGEKAREIGGYDGPEPTRFGDWQHKGRVTDF